MTDSAIIENPDERPRRPHQRELQRCKPEPARPEELPQLRGRVPQPVEERAGAGEKEENRRTEMRHPAGEEQSRPCSRQVFRIECLVAEEIPCVIQSHDHHRETAQEIDRFQPSVLRHVAGSGHALQCNGNGSGDERHALKLSKHRPRHLAKIAQLAMVRYRRARARKAVGAQPTSRRKAWLKFDRSPNPTANATSVTGNSLSSNSSIARRTRAWSTN